MARFGIWVQGEHSLDISETDDAQPSHTFEAHLLFKATQLGSRGVKEMFKTSLACCVNRQQLIEVLFLATSGLWVLLRLFSFTVLMSSAGLLPRRVV